MSRPKPTILLSHVSGGKAEQILVAEAIYAVFYDGKPINVKKVDNFMPQAKYTKCSFSNSGHAFNLAERLNNLFKTDSFTVVKLTSGEIIEEDE